MALTQVTSIGLKDGEIVNADLHSAASVALSKLADSGALGSAVTATTQSASDNSTKLATTAFVQAAVTNLIDGAPGSLNTLNELAAAINDDSSYATTLTTALATKAVLTGSTNNTVCTVTGANTLQGEANLTFDGTELTIGTANTTTGVLRAHPNYFSIDSGYANGGSVGGVVGSATAAALIFGGDSNTGLYHSASDTLNFTAGGNERLRITTSEIEIKNDASRMLNLITNSGTGSCYLAFSDSGGQKGYVGYGSGGNEVFYIVQNENAQIQFYSNGYTRAFLNADGKFNFDRYSATAGKGRIEFGNSGEQYIEGYDTGNAGSGSYLRFGDGNAERLRIISDGAVGINKTSPNAGLKLHVGGKGRFDDDLQVQTGGKINTNSSQGQLTIQGGATYPGSAIKFAGGQGGATDQGQMIFYAGTDTSLTERLRITSTGTLHQGEDGTFSRQVGKTSHGNGASKTYSISAFYYGFATFKMAMSDGNYKHAHIHVELGGMQYSSGNGYNATVVANGTGSGPSISLNKQDGAYHITVANGGNSNTLYGSWVLEASSYNNHAKPTLTIS